MNDLKELAETIGIPVEELIKASREELKRRQMSESYLEEPWIFYRELLCPPEKKINLRPFQKFGLEWATRKGGKRLKLILWPRGHLKSTIFTQSESVRRILLNPNLRILIKSSTEQMGETFLTAIKGHFQDERIIDLYGNLLPNNRSGKQFKDNKSELTVLTRTHHHLKEPTITVSGLEATKTSQHYDLIFCDDLVVRENVGTFDQMDKVWTIWQDLLDLLEPDGEMIVIGTRWHPLDLYGRIMSDYVDPQCFDGVITNHVRGCRCHFDVSVKTLRTEAGDYIFDSKFNEEKVQLLREVKGLREFSAQYENNPLASENLWFKESDIDKSLISPELIDQIRNRLVWYMMVDPAESTERRSSFTACVCVGVDHETGIWYVDFAEQKRVNTEGFITMIFGAVAKMRPHYFGMEKKTRKALEYVLKDKMAQFNLFWTINDLDPMLGNTPDAKKARICSLQPLFEHSRIRINSELGDLIKILKTIPSSISYDLADALSYLQQMIPKGLGSGTPSSLPVHVVQNKGLHYVVSRKRPRRKSGTQHRHGLGGFYSSIRTKHRGEGKAFEPVQGAAPGVHQVHGNPVPANVGQLQEI